jgi:hypothetical protein
VTAAEAWVRGRLAGAPPALLDAMIAALPADGELPVPDALTESALAIYARLLAGGAGARKEDALPLLAADALFTHALEAQAEIDPDGVAALAERMGASGSLAGLAG